MERVRKDQKKVFLAPTGLSVMVHVTGPCFSSAFPAFPPFSRHDICQKLHNRNIWEPSFTPKKSVNHDIVIFAPKHHVYNFDFIWRGQFLCIFRTPILSKYVKDDIKAKRVTLLWNWRARTIIIPSGRAHNVIVASWSFLLVLIQILDNLNAGQFIFTTTKPFITMPKSLWRKLYCASCVYCVLCNIYYVLCIVYHGVYCVLCIVFCVLCIMVCIMYSVLCKCVCVYCVSWCVGPLPNEADSRHNSQQSSPPTKENI